MNGVLCICLTLFSLESTSAWAKEYSFLGEPYSKNSLTFDKIKEIIRKEQISSVEEWLAYLKKNPRHSGYLKNFALAYESHGETEDVDPGSVSKDYPRAILVFDRMGMTFNTDPNHPKTFQRLEIIEFVPKTREFRSHRIDFNGKKADPTVSEDSTSCVKCHGIARRPIWQNYDFWIGIYGSLNDLLPENEAARKKFRDQILNAKSENRLNYLDFGNRTVEGFENEKRNTKITLHLNELNFETLMAKLEAWPLLTPYRYAIAGALFSCTNIQSFFSETLQKSHEVTLKMNYKELEVHTAKSIQAQLENKRNALSKYHGQKVAKEHGDFLAEQITYETRRLASLRYIFEGTGLEFGMWSLERDPGDVGYNNFYLPTGNGLDLGLRSRFINLFVSKFKEAEPEENAFYRDTPENLAYCAKLKEKSLAALKDVKLDPPKNPQRKLRENSGH